MQEKFFDRLIEKIEAHPTYGPAVRQAASDGWPLILDYHNHGNPSSWCVAICTRQQNLIPLLGPPEQLQELAHVSGLGRSQEDCLPLMGALSDELREHFELGTAPAIYLQGKPLGQGGEPER